jgi:hypothetical protein
LLSKSLTSSFQRCRGVSVFRASFMMHWSSPLEV